MFTSKIRFTSFVVRCQHFHERTNNRNKKQKLVNWAFAMVDKYLFFGNRIFQNSET